MRAPGALGATDRAPGRPIGELLGDARQRRRRLGPAEAVEAILSFLGVGLSPDIPTWGNVMAEGRVQFTQYPHNIFFPGVFLAVTVLAVNILGDGLRDTLDPKMARRL